MTTKTIPENDVLATYPIEFAPLRHGESVWILRGERWVLVVSDQWAPRKRENGGAS